MRALCRPLRRLPQARLGAAVRAPLVNAVPFAFQGHALRSAPALVHGSSPRMSLVPQRLFAEQAEEQTLRTLLNRSQVELLHKEQDLLRRLISALENASADSADIASIKTSLEQLEDLFLLVVVGEFNSGKSSFLNALLGQKYLEDGVTPTTSNIDLLRYGEKFSVTEYPPSEKEHRRVIKIPVDFLKDISLVDTPGTNAVFRVHQQITEHFVPRSDIVLWVTSADRPFSESERQFLANVEQYRKKIIVILSKIDLMANDTDKTQIFDFVRTQFKHFLGMEPTIFAVSSKKALEAKTEALDGGKPLTSIPLWEESQFAPLEKYILETLSSQERAWLKLKNPLGVSQHVLAKYLDATKQRLGLLKEDLAIIERIQNDLEVYRTDMLDDFKFHIERVDNVLLRMSERANDFLHDTVSLTNIVDLLKSEKIKRDFETIVIADAPLEIEKNVQEMVDWILKRNAKQWANVIETIQIRTLLNEKQMVGTVKTQFDYNREALLGDLGVSARKIINTFDKKAEGERLTGTIRTSIAQTAALEVGALGIGGLLSSSFFDVSGILPASAVAVVGLGVLPYTRTKLKASMRSKTEQIRNQMSITLRNQFEKHLNEGIDKIIQNMTPYSRFVKSEQAQIAASYGAMMTIDGEITSIGASIDRSFNK